jgi:hypothetical protein
VSAARGVRQKVEGSLFGLAKMNVCDSQQQLSFLSYNRHVILPKELAKSLPKSRLLTESEWRGIGVQQSRGWHHYAIHRYVNCLCASSSSF